MITIQTSGRRYRTSRKGTGAKAPGQETKIEQKISPKRKRHNREETGQKRPVTELILHPPVDVTKADCKPGRTRSNPIVYEAMELLRSFGYAPARVSEPSLPINIIGMKNTGSLLICTLRSRLPVPNAATLRELYTGKVDYLRGLASKVMDRIMIWVYSPACGWRYYIVYPGGLRYDHDFPRSIQ